MKAEELRIGNWVLTCTPRQQEGRLMIPRLQTQVQGITLFNEIIFCHTPTTQEGFNMPDKHVMGIPLTEEWLLKFGFERNGEDKKGNEKYRLLWDEGKFDIYKVISFYLDDEKCYEPEIKYVHQLQNLYFALTGKELTFNE